MRPRTAYRLSAVTVPVLVLLAVLFLLGGAWVGALILLAIGAAIAVTLLTLRRQDVREEPHDRSSDG